ncbi:MAG TPA: hypothetical protein VM345_04685 [Acidimicrobiales bacterium]|jgi:hypothetical protein|nr:hypothetical protein [Acidimicrobiales bacterium]
MRLYDKAKRAQWNAAADIDWSIDVDPLRVKDDRIGMLRYEPDSPFARLSERELAQLTFESQAWTVSQFLHGEQGALLATAKIVDTVPDNDAKLYAATQVMDEARHVEVYDRYLHEKLGRSYPINLYLEALLRDLLADPRWDMTYLGMQIMVESLALTSFGIASLEGLYDDMPEAERRDREEFVCEAAALMRDRFLQREVWDYFGLPVEECETYVREHDLQKAFRTVLFSKVVPNVKRIGLLTPYVRERFEQLDILQYEHAEASA